jgi:hypothetical protein
MLPFRFRKKPRRKSLDQFGSRFGTKMWSIWIRSVFSSLKGFEAKKGCCLSNTVTERSTSAKSYLIAKDMPDDDYYIYDEEDLTS